MQSNGSSGLAVKDFRVPVMIRRILEVGSSGAGGALIRPTANYSDNSNIVDVVDSDQEPFFEPSIPVIRGPHTSLVRVVELFFVYHGLGAGDCAGPRCGDVAAVCAENTF